MIQKIKKILCNEKEFYLRKESPKCFKCKSEDFKLIQWTEYDEKEVVEFNILMEQESMCATMAFIGPTQSHFMFEVCKKCGSMYKFWQNKEWYITYRKVHHEYEEVLMKRCEYWKDKTWI